MDDAPLKTDRTLLDRAILKPARNGLSTLHLLLGSLSPTFDLQTMALYVRNFQLATAKQLLRLFRVRYPSAYKAEIVRKGSSKSNSEGSSSEGSGEEGGEGEDLLAGVQRDPLLPGGTGRVRHSYRRIRKLYDCISLCVLYSKLYHLKFELATVELSNKGPSKKGTGYLEGNSFPIVNIKISKRG